MVQEIGETREAMREKLLSDQLYKIAKEAHQEKKLNEFWIVISHKPDQFLSGVIREGIVVTNKKPQKMLGSMCFHVVWDKGFFQPEWILPLDLGVDLPMLGSDGHSELIQNFVAPIGAALR